MQNARQGAKWPEQDSSLGSPYDRSRARLYSSSGVVQGTLVLPAAPTTDFFMLSTSISFLYMNNNTDSFSKKFALENV